MIIFLSRVYVGFCLFLMLILIEDLAHAEGEVANTRTLEPNMVADVDPEEAYLWHQISTGPTLELIDAYRNKYPDGRHRNQVVKV